MADEEHENWVRYNCFDLARRMAGTRDLDEIIEYSKKIEQYVSGRPNENVKKLDIIKNGHNNPSK